MATLLGLPFGLDLPRKENWESWQPINQYAECVAGVTKIRFLHANMNPNLEQTYASRQLL